MKKGFTLIELMIVVAIIAIIAAIAIPNLLESRIQANETNAIAALKAYATAQQIWAKANYSAKLDNSQRQWYCTDFGALYSLQVNEDDGTGTIQTRRVKLIAEQFSSAIDVNNGYQGFYFTEGFITKYDYTLYANPCLYGKSGVNSFTIQTSGVVYGKDSLGTEIVSGSPDSSWFTP